MPGETVVGNIVIVAVVYSAAAAGSDVGVTLVARRGRYEAVMHSPRGHNAGSRYEVPRSQGVHLS